MVEDKKKLGFKCNPTRVIKYFFSLVQLPSSCKMSEQSDKMPRNESKNKIIVVKENTFHM